MTHRFAEAKYPGKKNQSDYREPGKLMPLLPVTTIAPELFLWQKALRDKCIERSPHRDCFWGSKFTLSYSTKGIKQRQREHYGTRNHTTGYTSKVKVMPDISVELLSSRSRTQTKLRKETPKVFSDAFQHQCEEGTTCVTICDFKLGTRGFYALTEASLPCYPHPQQRYRHLCKHCHHHESCRHPARTADESAGSRTGRLKQRNRRP